MILKSIEGLVKHDDKYVSPLMNIQTIVSTYSKPVKELLEDRLEQIKLSKVAKWETYDITIKPSDWIQSRINDLFLYKAELPCTKIDNNTFKLESFFNVMHDDLCELNKDLRFKYLFSDPELHDPQKYLYCNIQPKQEITGVLIVVSILDLEAVKEPDMNITLSIAKNEFYKVSDKMYKSEYVFDFADYNYDITCTFDQFNIIKYIDSECRYITAEYLNGKIILTSEKALTLDIVLIFNRIKEVN